MNSIDPEKSSIRRSDKGWTTPWILAGGISENCITQPDIRLDGDLALMMTEACAIERHFPTVSSGILSIEMTVRSQHPTVTIDDPESSVLKVYAADEDQEGSWAFRWHHPYAWPEVGGNTYPRFYVVDGRGKKRKGLEYTDFKVEAGRWYRVDVVLDMNAQTWQFRVDGVTFDAVAQFGQDMLWWKTPIKLNKVRLQSVNSGKNWIDAIAIRHEEETIAFTDFDEADGYLADKTVV